MPEWRNCMDIDKISVSNLWYLVGLITSDGYLSPDGRHVDITAKDYKFLYELKKVTGINNRIGVKNNGTKRKTYRIQVSNKAFYRFLISLGLKTKKSLDIKKIEVPNQRFNDFLRGLIDGDGNIRRWIHPRNRCEQWVLRIYSGSEPFVAWLEEKIEEFFSVKGKIHFDKGKSTHGCYILKYGKMAAKAIFKNCYHKNSFGMARKRRLAYKCINSSIGWTKSKTVTSYAGVLELADNRDLKSRGYLYPYRFKSGLRHFHSFGEVLEKKGGKI